MKRKKLPKQKGKGMSIFCLEKNCKKQFSWTQKKEDNKTIEPSCGLSNKKLSSCKHLSSHRYRVAVHIPGTKKGEAKKTLTASNYEEALIESIEFRTQFLEELTGQQSLNHEKIYLNYLFSAQIEYLNFLRNINVPEHEKKIRSDKYIKEQKKCLSLFNKSLTLNKINTRLITLEKITPEHVGYYHAYLLNDLDYSNSTYNKKMTSLSTFFEWALEKYSVDRKNPFSKVQKRSTFVNKDSISKKEFESLLNIITPENGTVISKSKKRTFKRNLYRPFLKDALKLALHTGGRREEIVALRWNMIKELNNKPAFIHVSNFKVERMAGEATKDGVAPKIIPITTGLMKILNDLGYKDNIRSNNHILCPNRTNLSTATIMDAISKGFNHYYKQLNTERTLLFKCLRKTYLTYLDIAIKGDTKTLSSHSTDDILQKHYIDEKIVSSAVKNLNIFEE